MQKRLSRTESHALTRAKLIESATVLYLRDGYAATSNNQVAEAAGFSRGAVYSNFASKEDLALAVLDQFLDAEIATISAAVGDGTVDERFAAFERWMLEAARERRWAMLKSELAVASRHSPMLRRELAERDETVHRTVTALLTALFAEAGLEAFPITPPTLARLLIAVAKGVAIDGVVEPDKSAEWLTELLATLRAFAAMLGG
ncbi:MULTISPECIES: TetR/AcrR family transcriptional regulator [unclassified Nocardia]|uniref:TetR/AcrR family transcriptional regulator n=1 Tax=unclassified Nocardia TaxID=2637762 RepID=UPI0033A42F54